MKVRHLHQVTRGTLFLFLFLLLPNLVTARVTGPCVNCHTMHNSQDNYPVTKDGQLHNALLLTDCIGCHTGTNTTSSKTPFVFDTTPPLYRDTGTEADSNTLAGGNFYWVASVGTIIGDRLGHNVAGITAPDATLTLPPGGDGTFNGQLSCAGTNGCHGRSDTTLQVISVKGGHHNKDNSVWQDGSTLAKSYRLLENVQGFGDPDYEFRPTSERHNKYFGKDRTSESDEAVGTISAFCARCHQYFHDGSGYLSASSTFGNGVWLRHPTDFDMSGAISSEEYAYYNDGNGTSNTYSVISPVATEDDTATVNTVIYARQNDAVVMCLSCHRAHGTPHPGLLRWDYKSWPGGGYNGCAVCHTTKN